MLTSNAPALAVTTLSSAEFEIERAKEAAKDGPVFLTDGDQKTHVLLGIGAYKRLSHEGLSLFEALYYPPLAEVDDDFESPRIDGPFKPAEFD